MDLNRLLAAAALLLFTAAAFAIAVAAPGFEPEAVVRRLDRVTFVALARAGERVVAAGERGRVLWSDDAGATWSVAATPTYQTITSLAFADARTGFATGHQGTLLRTTDGGANWRQAQIDRDARPTLFAVHVDATRAIAVGAFGAYFESLDAGRHWTQRAIAPADFDRHLTGIAPCGDGCLVIAGEAGTLLRSTDAGATWKAVSSPYEGSFFGALGIANGTVIAYGMRGHAFRSEDQGRSWKAIELGGYAGALQGARQAADGTVSLVGADGFLAESRDGGATFTRAALGGRPTLAAVVDVGPRRLAAGPAGLRWADDLH